MATVSQRFQRIPSLQQQRESEYGKQAKEAERLWVRMRETRLEAEKAAKEEIDRTRNIQFQEVQRHPEMKEWRRRVSETEMEVRKWSVEAERRSQEIRERLASLEKQLARKQSELEGVQRSMAGRKEEEQKMLKQINDIEGQLEGLKREKGDAKLAEDDYSFQLSPSGNTHESLRKDLEDLKQRRAEVFKKWEGLKSQEASLVTSMHAIVRELEKARSDLDEWDRRSMEIQDNFNRAERLQADAQALESEHAQKVDRIKNDESILAQRLRGIEEERGRLASFVQDLSSRVGAKQLTIQSMEFKIAPLSNRQAELVEQMKGLERELGTVEMELRDHQVKLDFERMDLNSILPELEIAEGEEKRADDVFRQCFQELSNCSAMVQEEERKAQQFGRQAQQAHEELNRANNLRQEAETGKQTCIVKISEKHDAKLQIERDLEAVRNMMGSTSLGPMDREIESRQADLDSLDQRYRALIGRHREAKERREILDHQVAQTESKLRELRMKFDEFSKGGPSSLVDRLRSEVQQLEGELGRMRGEMEIQGGTNPFEARLSGIRQRSSEIEDKICASWTTATAPRILIDQLKREAEAVMRAEAALALEKQQEQVYDDACKIAKYHINTKPKFDMDAEAQGALIREHQTNVTPREIASTVLEMCEKKHIYA